MKKCTIQNAKPCQPEIKTKPKRRKITIGVNEEVEIIVLSPMGNLKTLIIHKGIDAAISDWSPTITYENILEIKQPPYAR